MVLRIMRKNRQLCVWDMPGILLVSKEEDYVSSWMTALFSRTLNASQRSRVRDAEIVKSASTKSLSCPDKLRPRLGSKCVPFPKSSSFFSFSILPKRRPIRDSEESGAAPKMYTTRLVKYALVLPHNIRHRCAAFKRLDLLVAFLGVLLLLLTTIGGFRDLVAVIPPRTLLS